MAPHVQAYLAAQPAHRYSATGQEGRCRTCRRSWPAGLLDAKDDGTGDFTILECPDCYGPGWSPL